MLKRKKIDIKWYKCDRFDTDK